MELQGCGIARSSKSQNLSGIALPCLLVYALSFSFSQGESWGRVGRSSPWFSYVFFPERVASDFQGATFCGPGLLQSKFHLSTVTTLHQEKHNSSTLHGCSNLPAVPSGNGKAWSLSLPCQLPVVSPHEKVKSLCEFQLDWVSAAGVPFLTELLPPER